MKKLLLLSFVLGFNQLANAQKEFSSHRGSSIQAPENTVAAVSMAWKEGADAVEIDIHLSKDNRLMVIHDSNTKRTSGKDYVIKNTLSDSLRLLDVGSFKGEKYKNEKIPFLEEIISIIPPKKKLIVELKCGVEGFPALKKILDTSPKKGQIDLICFDFEVISAAKKIFPKIDCHLLYGKSEDIETVIKKASLNGIEAVDLKYSIINQKVVDYVHELSMKVYAWTVDDGTEAKRLLALNVDGIESNCVPCLKELMRK